jgi:hypothetical protein
MVDLYNVKLERMNDKSTEVWNLVEENKYLGTSTGSDGESE